LTNCGKLKIKIKIISRKFGQTIGETLKLKRKKKSENFDSKIDVEIKEKKIKEKFSAKNFLVLNFQLILQQ
jgi:hypothetical protein